MVKEHLEKINISTHLKAIENSSSSQSTILTAAKEAFLGKSSLPPTTPGQIVSDNTVWFC